jgi:hypothetical protein
MLEFLLEHLNDRQFLITTFAAVAALQPFYVMPLWRPTRWKAHEGSGVRARRSDSAARTNGAAQGLAAESPKNRNAVVERFNLTNVRQEDVREAGAARHRGQALYHFSIFRLVTPIITLPSRHFGILGA